MGLGVETGRRVVRYPCPSCGVRYKVGTPKPHDAWPAQLAMNSTQLDLLLVAAAEFRDLCEECETCNHSRHGLICGDWCPCTSYIPRGGNDPISFLDWVKPEALSRSFDSPVNVQREAASAAERRR